MKKFFQRLDNSSAHRGDYQREGSATAHGISFIGKVFTVGQFQCTVEDTIAEGMLCDAYVFGRLCFIDLCFV